MQQCKLRIPLFNVRQKQVSDWSTQTIGSQVLMVPSQYRNSLKILKMQVGEHGSTHLTNCLNLVAFCLNGLADRLYWHFISVNFNDTWTSENSKAKDYNWIFSHFTNESFSGSMESITTIIDTEFGRELLVNRQSIILCHFDLNSWSYYYSLICII